MGICVRVLMCCCELNVCVPWSLAGQAGVVVVVCG